MGVSVDLISRKEVDRRNVLETIIKKGLMWFAMSGLALREIRDDKLFRDKYASWKIYLREEWDMGKSYADRLIRAVEVLENLIQNGAHGHHFNLDELVNNDTNWCHSDIVLPKNERQARPLTLLESTQQPEAWKQTLLVTNGNVTALAVTKVVQEILEAQLQEEKQGIQERIIKEISVPDDFTDQFTKMVEILDLHRKSGWKNFNRKKALEFLKSIESYINS